MHGRPMRSDEKLKVDLIVVGPVDADPEIGARMDPKRRKKKKKKTPSFTFAPYLFFLVFCFFQFTLATLR